MERYEKLMAVKGNQTVDTFHRKLGHIMWEYVGMARNREGLEKAIVLIRELREEFWKDVRIPGSIDELNIELDKAMRMADYLDLGELMARDGLERNESCGGHFREEFQTAEGEALRDDKNYTFVAAWEYKGPGQDPVLHKEPIIYESIEVKQRNYK